MSIDQLRDVKLITALITPFHEDGSINYDALPELIDQHLFAAHQQRTLHQVLQFADIACVLYMIIEFLLPVFS